MLLNVLFLHAVCLWREPTLPVIIPSPPPREGQIGIQTELIWRPAAENDQQQEIAMRWQPLYFWVEVLQVKRACLKTCETQTRHDMSEKFIWGLTGPTWQQCLGIVFSRPGVKSGMSRSLIGHHLPTAADWINLKTGCWKRSAAGNCHEMATSLLLSWGFAGERSLFEDMWNADSTWHVRKIYLRLDGADVTTIIIIIIMYIYRMMDIHIDTQIFQWCDLEDEKLPVGDPPLCKFSGANSFNFGRCSTTTSISHPWQQPFGRNYKKLWWRGKNPPWNLPNAFKKRSVPR